ncbi:TetR/AcrR family transcriptional regulator [Sphaerisporangium sp. NPDC051011]|uniref:TetR/AcrR family transcriptional regulator n=1 Tax=Sphaerisporangium sp. NPDC051011 TaxID=3155792 RepID=UPI00340B5358
MTKIHSKQQLIAAAEKVFLEKGYDAARVEDIGAELGVLQGSLYYHIGSKAGLLRLVLRHRFTSMTEQIEEIAASSASVRDKLRSAVIAQLSYHNDRLPDSPQWFKNPGGPKESAADIETDRKMVARFRQAWHDILADGIERGEIRSEVDPDAASLSILGMCNYMARWYEAHAMTHEAIADSQLELIWTGMAPREIFKGD